MILSAAYSDYYSEAIKDSNNNVVQCSIGHSLHYFTSFHDKDVLWVCADIINTINVQSCLII